MFLIILDKNNKNNKISKSSMILFDSITFFYNESYLVWYVSTS
jgi:hypothetical protein